MGKCTEGEREQGIGTERIDRDNMHLTVLHCRPVGAGEKEKERAASMLCRIFKKYGGK